MTGRQRSGRTRRPVYSREQTTSKTISVSPEVLAELISRQYGNEAMEDTLRRELGMKPRKPLG